MDADATHATSSALRALHHAQLDADALADMLTPSTPDTVVSTAAREFSDSVTRAIRHLDTLTPAPDKDAVDTLRALPVATLGSRENLPEHLTRFASAAATLAPALTPATDNDEDDVEDESSVDHAEAFTLRLDTDFILSELDDGPRTYPKDVHDTIRAMPPESIERVITEQYMGAAGMVVMNAVSDFARATITTLAPLDDTEDDAAAVDTAEGAVDTTPTEDETAESDGGDGGEAQAQESPLDAETPGGPSQEDVDSTPAKPRRKNTFGLWRPEGGAYRR